LIVRVRSRATLFAKPFFARPFFVDGGDVAGKWNAGELLRNSPQNGARRQRYWLVMRAPPHPLRASPVTAK